MFNLFGGAPPAPDPFAGGFAPDMSDFDLAKLQLAANRAGDAESQAQLGQVIDQRRNMGPTPKTQALATGVPLNTTDKAQAVAEGLLRGRGALLDALDTGQ